MFALLGSTAAFSQQPPPGMQVGMLTCNLAPSIGLIVAESQRMSCRFVPNGPHPPQTYSGVMNTVGLELGVTAAGVMAWGVFAPVARLGPGGLSGDYAGAQGSASLGVGAGGHALFGGSANSIALQPLSVQGQVGLNVAAGLESLELRPGR